MMSIAVQPLGSTQQRPLNLFNNADILSAGNFLLLVPLAFPIASSIFSHRLCRMRLAAGGKCNDP